MAFSTGGMVMEIRNATAGDMKLLGHIMAVSFRSAFCEFVSQQTLDACAQEDNCTKLLEDVFSQGNMHFLIGEDSGMLVWQPTEDGAEIVAIHSLPESWGSGLGHVMIEKALEQIGNVSVSLWAFEDNRRARRFYEKHGFYWDGSRRISEFDGAAEVRYVLRRCKLHG